MDVTSTLQQIECCFLTTNYNRRNYDGVVNEGIFQWVSSIVIRCAWNKSSKWQRTNERPCQRNDTTRENKERQKIIMMVA